MNLYRIIDANINRASEGLRILEDIARFVIEDFNISKELRDLRHCVRKTFKSSEMLTSRDSENDLGLTVSQNTNVDNKEDLSDLLEANFKRLQEALRSIEESLKVLGYYNESKIYETIRFKSYSLEKKILIRRALPDTDIYGILGEDFSKGRNNVDIVRDMIGAGIRIIQYREKNKSKLHKYQECKTIRALTKNAGVTFIVNDDVDIALSIKADGLHIGQDDLPIEEVKKIAGDMLIGLSTHNENQAKEAIVKGADYIGVGPIYKTNTKKNLEESQGLKYLEWVSKNIPIPYVAIGGIKESNILEVKEHGGKCFAMISEIVGSEDMKGKVERIRRKIEDN